MLTLGIETNPPFLFYQTSCRGGPDRHSTTQGEATKTLVSRLYIESEIGDEKKAWAIRTIHFSYSRKLRSLKPPVFSCFEQARRARDQTEQTSIALHR